jgi:hypothetical protein
MLVSTGAGWCHCLFGRGVLVRGRWFVERNLCVLGARKYVMHVNAAHAGLAPYIYASCSHPALGDTYTYAVISTVLGYCCAACCVLVCAVCAHHVGLQSVTWVC